MTEQSIGVAVIGAGMAGRAHAAGYRAASGVYEAGLPPVRLVAIADINRGFAQDAARRFGYERAETSWEAIAQADDIDAVSIVVANDLHREVAEALLAAGKHVLCEKPFAPTIEDGEAMVTAAAATDRAAAVGFTFRRSPAIAAIRDLLASGAIGRPLHLTGHYFCDYANDPGRPMSWRYRGGPGSGALADIGSHLIDVAEYLCGPVTAVRGGALTTSVAQRPLPLGQAVGHAATAVSDVHEPVENEDVASLIASFDSGAVASLTASRVAHGLPNSLGFEIFAERGAARFDLARAGEFEVSDNAATGATAGWRTVLVGPAHPYLSGGLAMDFPGVGYGQNDLFVFQARAFLEQVAGASKLEPVPTFAHGLHNLRLMRAVVESAGRAGAEVAVPTSPEGKP